MAIRSFKSVTAYINYPGQFSTYERLVYYMKEMHDHADFPEIIPGLCQQVIKHKLYINIHFQDSILQELH